MSDLKSALSSSPCPDRHLVTCFPIKILGLDFQMTKARGDFFLSIIKAQGATVLWVCLLGNVLPQAPSRVWHFPSPQGCSAAPTCPSLRVQPQGSRPKESVPNLHFSLFSLPRERPGQNGLEETPPDPSTSTALQLFHVLKT